MLVRLIRISLVATLLIGAFAAFAAAQAADQNGSREPLVLSGSFFAVEKAGPIERLAHPVTPENPIPRRTIFVAPLYPDAAAVVDARLVVHLRVTVDESGYVVEARRIEAPLLVAWRHPLLKEETMSSVFDALVTSSIEAVRQWRYEAPVIGPIAFDVSIAFAPDAEPRAVSPTSSPEP
jgi:outer membrane biosynthesis protein TonB